MGTGTESPSLLWDQPRTGLAFLCHHKDFPHSQLSLLCLCCPKALGAPCLQCPCSSRCPGSHSQSQLRDCPHGMSQAAPAKPLCREGSQIHSSSLNLSRILPQAMGAASHGKHEAGGSLRSRSTALWPQSTALLPRIPEGCNPGAQLATALWCLWAQRSSH